MALINCLECRREVSDRAPSCPQCGCPIAAPPPRPAAPPPAAAPQFLNIKHDDRSGFSKGVERGLETVGTQTAKGCMTFVIAGAVLLVVALALMARSAMVCTECNGSGKNYLFFKCEKCDGTGWKK